MSKMLRLLAGGAISLFLLLAVLAGITLADPANAVLTVTPNTTMALPGDTISVTVTLDDMDAAEVFKSWTVRLGYDPSVLDVAEVTVHTIAWNGGFPGPPVDVRNPDNLYFGQANFGGDSGTGTPFLFATIEFTVTSMGNSNFSVITTDLNNDTSFVRTDDTLWQPGTINIQDVQNTQDEPIMVGQVGPGNFVDFDGVSLTVRFDSSETTTPVDTNGVFTLSSDLITAGTYTICVKELRTLAMCESSVTVPDASPPVTASFGDLTSGDGDGNNLVDTTDFSVWVTVFGAGGYEERADYNNDGIVDTTDFSVWVTVFGSDQTSWDPW